MFSIGVYLIKACVYAMAFYLPFALILKRSTFFAINRVYLVSGLILSFVLPLYTGPATIPSYAPPELPFMEPLMVQTESAISQATKTTGSLNIVDLIIILYLSGVVVRLVLLTSSVRSILKLKKKGEIVAYQNLNVVKTNTPVPFSFLNYVFLPQAIVPPGVLEHEAAHVRQYHWLDLLIAEFASIVLWFNPAMNAYKHSLKQQHEYLADRSAIGSGISLADYLTCIRQQLEPAIASPLTSAFTFHSIKNRINMMTRKRTPVYGLATYTIVLPVIFCLLMAFSSRKDFQIAIPEETDPGYAQVTFGLPIDKEYGFSLASGYGERMHPVLGVMRLHTGIDLVAEEGVPVVSTEAGVVIKAHLAHAWGNIIVVQHDDKYSTSYSHLKSMNVKVGDKVQKGEVIGLVGHTGLSNKDHLHFELHENGVAIDPINHLPQIK